MPLNEKRWDKAFEEPLYKGWRNKYPFDEKTTLPIYSIDTPPPYVNSPIHIGHAVTYAMMDFFARFKRMTGHHVLFPLGLDRNGLPIEMAAEKKFNMGANEVPRKKFVQMCNQVLEESSEESIDSFAKLGISFSSWSFGTKLGDAYYTDSDTYRALTQATFIDLWNKGLVYEEKRLNNFCPGCQTTIADSEIERKEKDAFFNHVKVRVKETGEDVVIATTRPELLSTNAILIFNPTDKRYRHLDGKTAITPIYGHEVPIVADREAAKDFGTGIAYMSASAGDQDAVRFLRKRNIKAVQSVGEDGKMLPITGSLEGLTTKQARAKIIELLKEQGLLVKQEKIRHSVPICERSKHEIEFIAMKEYYLKQVEFKNTIKKLSKATPFYAPHSKQILNDWIDSVTMDWAISRRRVYATEIPLWYCKACSTSIVPPPGKYYRPWAEDPPVKACPKCKGKEFEPEMRVFDTWFDSSVSPLYILHYTDKPTFFKKAYPVSLRPQGKEIVRTWLFYSLLRCYQLTDQLPFDGVWINYHILDENGKKMSKSVGNVIDPHDIIKQYGAEVFRLWIATEGNITEGDLRCSSERIAGAGKFLTKLWNIARFISMFPDPPTKKPALLDIDTWILTELDKRIAEANKEFLNYNFHQPIMSLREFMWNIFADHYIELVKSRAYNKEGTFSKKEQEAALYTLNHVLDTALTAFAPVLPFITAKIMKDRCGKDVHEEPFPKQGTTQSTLSTVLLTTLDSVIWQAKKQAGKSLRTPVTIKELPQEIKPIEADFRAAHSIEGEIRYKKMKPEDVVISLSH